MLENPTPSLVKVRPIIEALVTALRALQRLNIVHRDLKPENVLIDENNNIKLIDFGAVKVDSLSEISDRLNDECPVGTAGYTAPEYFFGESGSHSSDIFSLGVILYEMICGKLPFAELNQQGKVTRYYSDWSYISLKKTLLDTPTWLDLTVQKACHPDPKSRYTAMSELLKDLNKPNPEFLENFNKKPLIERNPLLLWKCISASLAVIAIIQFIWIAHH
jgi:protein phosphatase